MSTFASSVRALLPAGALLSMALAGSTAWAASQTEGFEAVPVAGWTTVNNSTTVGLSGWFQGSAGVFSAQAGSAGSYIAANYNNTTGANATISNWFISPTLSFNNGDVVSFFTRTVDRPSYPDRLELRFSSVGGTNVGATPLSVGTFALLLSVNPTLTTTGYPSTWTQFSSAISGLSGPTNASIAFRYFVTSGGPGGLNSDYIGIDTLRITPVPEPAAYLMLALGLSVIALRRLSARQA